MPEPQNRHGLAVLSLDNVAGGAIPAKFERELRKVIENVLDENTDAKAARKIVVTVEFKPSADREKIAARVSVESSLAPHKSVSDVVFMGRENGEPVAVAFDPRQGDIFRPTADASVLPLNADRASR